MKLTSQSLQVGPTGSQGVPGASGPAGPVGPAGASLLQPPVVVTSAQLLALHATPKLVRAAPPPGDMHVALFMVVQLEFVSIPYVFAGNPILYVGWGVNPIALAAATTGMAGFLDQASNQTMVVPAGSNGFPTASVIDQALMAKLDAAVTVGDSTLRITLFSTPIP